MQNIKIKLWWLFYVNKRQFLLIYMAMSVVFISLMIIFWFIEMPEVADENHTEHMNKYSIC